VNQGLKMLKNKEENFFRLVVIYFWFFK